MQSREGSNKSHRAPNAAEIAAACRKIQAGWTAAVERTRASKDRDAPGWMPAQVRLADLIED